MNRVVAELFPNTKDAILVDRIFGINIPDNFISEIMLRGKEKEILERAKAIDLEEQKKLSQI